ncbi:MAG: hypothetical protein AAF416_14405 [Pseudomonadota bacterium]
MEAIEQKQIPQEDADADLSLRFAAIVGSKQSEAERRISRRKEQEERWLEDLEQYHGVYPHETLENLRETKRSKLFFNLTRVKTNAWSARLEDMLLPTDERNWAIRPTPVPMLADDAAQALREAQAAAAQAKQQVEQGQDPAAAAEATGLMQKAEQAEELRGIIDEAEKRSEAMMEEIDDLLVESQYQAAYRDVIQDGCKVGTGVLKSPVAPDRPRAKWRKDPESNVYQLMDDGSDDPAAYAGLRWVDYWSFFPDPEARHMGESESDFERHLCNAKRLRELARTPGFDPDAIRRLLSRGAPRNTDTSYLTSLRSITGESDRIEGKWWSVWEYSGPLDSDDLMTLYEYQGDAEGMAEMQDADPLVEQRVVMWFCDGELLKLSPYPLDSGESLYSVFCLEKQDGSIFGKGVPRIMRDQQDMLNAAGRMLMNNSGISTGPQVIIDQSTVTPANKSWVIEPMKVWLKKGGQADPSYKPFEIVNIDNRTEELVALIQLAEKHIDDVTALPMIAQGEQGTGVTKTAQGMAILMSSTNVVFKKVVKCFDDDLTKPTIRRLYDWLMQTSRKEWIKGDMSVEALGSSVLMVREMQAQNLIALAGTLAQSPAFGPMHKHYELAQAIYRAHQIDPSTVLVSEEDWQQMQEAQQEDPAVENADSERESKLAIAEMQADTQRYVADKNFEAMQLRLQMAQIEADARRADVSREKAADREAKERQILVEVADSMENPENTAGGIV